MIEVERITFTSAEDTLVGDLYLPAAHAGPAVVVAGSWTTVKEQMAGRYASALAACGIAAFCFDFRGYGQSGGTPRNFECPHRKVADLGAAINHLRTHHLIDGERIGALGVCAGAGYVATAAAAGHGLRSLALVAPWLHDAELVRTIYGGSDGVRQRMELGEHAVAQYRSNGDVSYVPAVSTEDADAAMYGEFHYYLDDHRGAVPQWSNRFALMSWPVWLSFDPIATAPAVTTPTLLVHSPDAAIPDGVQRFYRDLSCPKSLHWLSGSQFDFYDHQPTVDAALDLVVPHLMETL